MRNLMLKLEYDGTNYHGWQRQDNAITIQEVIEKALYKITGEELSVNGCSRTDTGVHANGYVCNFLSDNTIPADKMPYALKSVLPRDIVALSCEQVPEDFHARYSARGKKYKYRIINRVFSSPFHRNYTYHWPYPLDFRLMQRGARHFIGEHDFRAFMASGNSVKSTIRTIFDAQLYKEEDEIIFEISGNGFLYNMVRIIMGTLLYVGSGRIDEGIVADIINSGDRTRAGMTVPPQGLYLAEVYYPHV